MKAEKNCIRKWIVLWAVLSSPTMAYGYIDPGSGGYLFGSLFPMIAGFFAMGFAVILHFFRHTLKIFFKTLWQKHRWVFGLAAILIFAGIGFLGWHMFSESRRDFNPKLSGAHFYDQSAMDDGYNLFEGKLIDAHGQVIKQWKSLYLGVIDTNGDYYAQKYFESPLWGRYTWDDKVVWEKNYPIHHEILLTPNNTLITFTKEVHEYKGRKVEFDIILELDKDGNELQRFSLWENLKEFQVFHRPLELDMPPTFLIPEDHRKETSIWGGNYDYYHLNALSLVPPNALQGTHPAFRPGNWIISFRHGSMVFILDQDTKKVLWRAIYDQIPDKIEGPHSPQMLPNGNILLFDNGRYRKWSRLLEIDPVTLKVVWEYRAKDLYTLSQGHVQLLPNGNMLITESETGRALEITRDKRTVWEYYHPDRQNETNSVVKEKWGLRQEIYRMTRYPKNFIDKILGTA